MIFPVPAVVGESNRLARGLRPWLLGLIGGDLLLLAVRVAHYPTFFSNSGALTYLVEPVAALVVYATVVGVLPSFTRRVAGAPAAVRVGTVIGLLGGAIELADITLESLWSLPQPVVTLTTGVGMLALFALFGVAGFLGGRRTRSFWLGPATAIWCSMIAILIAVTFGFLLVNLALPQLAHGATGDPDFRRSGWTDVRAFAIANTFDNGFTHLVEAPVIATVLGAAGSGLGRLGVGTKRRAENR
ncbi:MAG TPA: hypothetical protein VGN32_21470 [Ktedonobacterales bacterium]|nr:hypothetical protein [Ktedonobacterales bacterium]